MFGKAFTFLGILCILGGVAGLVYMIVSDPSSQSVSDDQMAGFGVIGILLGAGTLMLSGIAAYRRSR